MSLVLIKGPLQDSFLVKPSVFEDYRGEFLETFNKEVYKKICNEKFVQDNISFSYKNVLRGLHGDSETWKLIQCVQGTIFLVMVDLRSASTTYCKHHKVIINDKNRTQVLIPSGCAVGYLCLSDMCIVSYKQTTYYKENKSHINIKWNDPRFKIKWPISNPILSEKDAG